MRDIFSDERNYNFKSEITGLPRQMSATDIDVMLRGKREMLAIELKHTKEMQAEMPVSAPQYYTYKYLSMRGIPAFYLFKLDSGETWVYFVERHAEPSRHDGKLWLPKKEMGKHKTLNEVTTLLAKLLQAQEAYKKQEVVDLLQELTKQKLSLEDYL